jgi:uncharacterized protein (UPF0264 family)
MQLLVSVADAREARAARVGGADVIDAKNPHCGALGAVSEPTLRAIRAAAGHPFSAALGDEGGAAVLARRTRVAAQLGAGYVKVGFRDIQTSAGVRARAVAVLGARAGRPGTRVVLVAYADWSRAGSAAPPIVLEVAAATGAAGVLLDTAYKDTALFALWSPEIVAAWLAAVQRAELFAALAGSLTARDVPLVRALGADLVGVRGAACVGGRLGRVTRARVAVLSGLARGSAPLRAALA